MFKFTLTFKRQNGSTITLAYRAVDKKHAVFNATNELGKLGELNLVLVRTVEHSAA